jgi:hypothetical protein
MATWKKVIVSGSNAELATLNATAVTASLLGNVVGDLTGTASWATNVVNVPQAVSASYAISASFATQLATAQDFSITGGGITATAVSFNGTGDVVLDASIDSGAVGTDELAADAVTNAKLADNAVETANILDLNVTTGKLAAGAVTNAKLATDAVETLNIVDLNVTTGKLADDAVTTAKIAAGAVGTTELAADAVTNAKLADNAVETLNIVDANVTNAKLENASLTLGTTEIALGVTASTLAGLTLTGVDATGTFTGSFSGSFTGTTDLPDLSSGNGLTGGPYDGSSIATFAVLADGSTLSVSGTGVKVADSGITATQIATGAVGTDELAADAVTNAKLADNAVETLNILDLNVTTGKIADDAVTTAKIAAGAVGATELAADSVTNVKLADNAVETINIVAANVTNDKLANSSLTVGSTSIALGASATTLAGLTSVTSTTFVGALTGNADTATTANTASYVAASSAAQGQVTVTGTVVDLGLETTDSVTFANLAVNGSGSFSGALVVQGDLTVNGTASFINTQDLLIEDKFVTFASGSTVATDGGFIVSQAAGNIGQAFAFQSGTGRWGVESGVAYNATSITPDAYVSLVATQIQILLTKKQVTYL